MTTDAPPPDGPDQLALPIPDLLLGTPAGEIPPTKRVFVNRNLRLADIEWIGFDMDYTLAIYDQAEMDGMQIRETLTRLVDRGYPRFILDLPYDFRLPIRGLIVDKHLGHVLKMDRYKVVHKAWRGKTRLAPSDVHGLYDGRRARIVPPRFHFVDTLYALAEVTMYVEIIEAYAARRHPLDTARLFEDIRGAIDEAHRDGSILDTVLGDLPRYVSRDPDLAQTLHRWRSAGKRLFVLTNSRASYTDAMMRHLIGTALPEYPSWRHYFDAIVVAAGKPDFFLDKRPILERDGDETRPITSFSAERGKLYEGGNLWDLERLLGSSGDRILYVGDHIFGDILRSKKESAWRTSMIIQEMVEEVTAHRDAADDLDVLARIEEARERTESELRAAQVRIRDLSRQIDAWSSGITPRAVLEAERAREKRQVDRIRAELRAIEAEQGAQEAVIDKRFHAYWGSLLKEGNELSKFGSQVEEYACLYTSRVSNFGLYSPLQHFRSPRDKMPHEL